MLPYLITIRLMSGNEITILKISLFSRIKNHTFFILPIFILLVVGFNVTIVLLFLLKKRPLSEIDFLSPYGAFAFCALGLIAIAFALYRDTHFYFKPSTEEMTFSWPIFKRQFSVKKSHIIGANICVNGILVIHADIPNDRVSAVLFPHLKETDLPLLEEKLGISFKNLLVTKRFLPDLKNFIKFYRENLEKQISKLS